MTRIWGVRYNADGANYVERARDERDAERWAKGDTSVVYSDDGGATWERS